MNLLSLLSKSQSIYNTSSNFYPSTSTSQSHNNNKKKITSSSFKTSKQQFLIKIFEQNIDILSSFLNLKQINSIRLTCRGISYLFIIRDVWMGIKHSVADKKLQDFDDYEFVEEIPKEISKQDKKIRIHSLRKNMVSVGKKSDGKVVVKKERQSSNIKQKKMAMTIVAEELNPFRQTEIGFKRLLKTSNPSLRQSLISSKYPLQKQHNLTTQSQSIQRLPQLLQIPSQYSIDDLIINVNGQWVKNIHRANNLITVVKKWNSFFGRFDMWGKREQYQLVGLMKKAIKIDGCILNYKQKWQQEPYQSILIMLQGGYKNTLIEQQLNKLARQFLQNHKKFMQLCQERQTEHIITNLHQLYQKTTSQQKFTKSVIQASQWIQGLNILEDSFQNLVSKLKNERLKGIFVKSILQIMKEKLEKHMLKEILVGEDEIIILKEIDLKLLIAYSEFFQLVFQILYNLYGKFANTLNNFTDQGISSSTKLIDNKQSSQFLNISKINSNRLTFIKLNQLQKSNQSKLLSSKSFSKWKSLTSPASSSLNFKEQKTLYGILWNISKYFEKLQKQMIAKEKKKKQQSKVLLIKKFLEHEANEMKEKIILCESEQVKEKNSKIKKSLSQLEEYYKNFKIKIENLKQEITATNEN